jgi:uncharacterized protein (UPF0332 family)
MREHTRKLLEKSLDVLEAAEVLLDSGKIDVAAGRAYYSMMHTAEALLFEEKDLSFNKHGDIHAAYGLHFAKTKILDPKFHRWLLDAFDQRIVGDYDVSSGLDKDLVSEIIEQAREFLHTARNYLEDRSRSN